jgi:hypothetical protein
MNKIRTTFLIVLGTVYISQAQVLKLIFGPAFEKTKTIVPIVNGESFFENTTYLSGISYEHFLPKSKFSIISSYVQFDGYTFIDFQDGGVISDLGSIIGATGFNGTKISKFELGTSYNLIKAKKKFYFSPFLLMGIQITKKNGFEIYDIPANGPDYVQTAPKIAEPLNTTQLTPSLGLKTGFVFWKRLDIGLSVQGVYAAKPYQKLYFDYSYKGVPQPTGIFSSSGTGLFYTIGIGYRFTKFIK